MTTPPLTLKKTQTAVATSQHRRPIIGIAGHMLPNGNSVGVTFPYLNYFEKFYLKIIGCFEVFKKSIFSVAISSRLNLGRKKTYIKFVK